MSVLHVSINGKILNAKEASLNISDLSIQRGYGIFDFLKVVNSKPVFIDDYLDRFFNSVKEMSMEIDFNRSALKEQIGKLMNVNNFGNSGIKIILTGGYSEDGYTSTQPNLLITETPFKVNTGNFLKGIKLVTYNHQRQLPSVKTIDYLQAIRLSKFIKEHNAEDVLYYDNGQLRECPRANIFVVRENEIITPKTNILRGITRKKILELKLEGYRILEKDFDIEELASISEAFICSSTKNILPVIAINGIVINNGKVGAIATNLNLKLTQLIENYVN